MSARSWGRQCGDEEHEVDWGGSDIDDEQPAITSPRDMGGDRDDDDNPVTSDTLSREMRWPWGERGRPWHTASPNSAGARRPRTPSRSPRRRGTDLWCAIQRVQRHMSCLFRILRNSDLPVATLGQGVHLDGPGRIDRFFGHQEVRSRGWEIEPWPVEVLLLHPGIPETTSMVSTKVKLKILARAEDGVDQAAAVGV